MPALPAFCDSCGAIFPSGIVVENSTNIAFSNCTAGPCPRCGGRGHVPDGVFNFIGATIEVLSAPTRTVDDLKRFARIIERARAEKLAKNEIAKQLREEVPNLSRLADLLPANRVELYAFLAVVVAAIPLFKSQDKGNITINNVVTSIYNQPAKPAPIKEAKPGRNDLCPCGSGKKFKKCHGASAK